ncbi:MAG: tetratricopeptide repeat protein, partial [Myxococcota bacterium]
LTTLQRWIVERKVSRDDEISRTGQKWERLGNIAELATFFQVVEQAAEPKPVVLSAPTPEPAPPAPAPAPKPEPKPEPVPAVVSEPAADFGADDPLFEDDGPSEFSGDDDALDDDDDFDFGQKSGRRAAILLAVALILAAGGAVYTFFGEQIVMLLSGAGLPSTTLAAIDSAEARLAQDVKEAFDQSAEDLEPLAIEYPDSAEVMVAEANVAMARAHHARFHRSIEEYAPDGMPRPLAENPGLIPDEEVVELLKGASDKLEAAALLAPKSYRVAVAQAELQTLRGNTEEVKKVLKSLRKLDGGPAFDPKLSMIRGELDSDPDEMTKASDSGWIRARLQLAFYRLDSGAVDVAEKLVGTMAEHPTAKALQKIIDAKIATAAAEAVAEEPATDEVREFDRILSNAERARRADRTNRALRLYEKALELEPGNVDALTGIGWTYIDLEETSAAIATFAQVIRGNERYSEGHMGLAEAYNQKGLRRDAVKHYRRYLELLPDGPEASVARRMIEQLQ